MERKRVPGVILHRIFISALVGVICGVIGVSYYITADRDLPFMLLSLAITAGCGYKAAAIWRWAQKGQIAILEGDCIACTHVFRRFQEVVIVSGDGERTTLKLQKGTRLKCGEKYRLYFRNDENQLRIGNQYLDTLFSAGCFLGLERVTDKEPEASEK